jgi:hypothetical protein
MLTSEHVGWVGLAQEGGTSEQRFGASEQRVARSSFYRKEQAKQRRKRAMGAPGIDGGAQILPLAEICINTIVNNWRMFGSIKSLTIRWGLVPKSLRSMAGAFDLDQLPNCGGINLELHLFEAVARRCLRELRYACDIALAHSPLTFRLLPSPAFQCTSRSKLIWQTQSGVGLRPSSAARPKIERRRKQSLLPPMTIWPCKFRHRPGH